jgi:hypothetical protein
MRNGLLAEFESGDALLRAFAALERAGYTRLTTFTPYPVRGVVTRLPDSIVPWIMLGAGIFGATFGYVLQWWCSARNYPLNVGGRPLNSIPAFVPIAFESALLAASVTGFLVTLSFCGLPRLSHPVFAVDGFERASVDRFWVGVDGGDPRYGDDLEKRMIDLGALRCERIPEIP